MANRTSLFPFFEFLRGTKVSNAGVGKLQVLVKFHRLNLSRTQVSDAGLKYLKGLTKLDELYLSKTKISDRGLQYLKELPSLLMTDLDGTEVTPNGIKELERVLRSRRTQPVGVPVLTLVALVIGGFFWLPTW